MRADLRPDVLVSLAAVCGSVVLLELHHLAPRAVFGPECESWPTVEVCHPCHKRWHALMDRV